MRRSQAKHEGTLLYAYTVYIHTSYISLSYLCHTSFHLIYNSYTPHTHLIHTSHTPHTHLTNTIYTPFNTQQRPIRIDEPRRAHLSLPSQPLWRWLFDYIPDYSVPNIHFNTFFCLKPPLLCLLQRAPNLPFPHIFVSNHPYITPSRWRLYNHHIKPYGWVRNRFRRRTNAKVETGQAHTGRWQSQRGYHYSPCITAISVYTQLVGVSCSSPPCKGV